MPGLQNGVSRTASGEMQLLMVRQPYELESVLRILQKSSSVDVQDQEA